MQPGACRYYAAFPALSAQSEKVNQLTAKATPATGVWARPPGNWSDEQDSGSSSRDSSGERKEAVGPTGDQNPGNGARKRSRESTRQQSLTGLCGEDVRKAPSDKVCVLENFWRSACDSFGTEHAYIAIVNICFQAKFAIQPVGGKKRRGVLSQVGGGQSTEDADSDKENSQQRSKRTQQQQRDAWDVMKSPHGGSAAWSAALEPKFVVPRLKSHIMSPSATKMKMRSENLASPIWRDLVFSCDDEFDKVTFPNILSFLSCHFQPGDV